LHEAAEKTTSKQQMPIGLPFQPRFFFIEVNNQLVCWMVAGAGVNLWREKILLNG
jgi:hypothetical protein